MELEKVTRTTLTMKETAEYLGVSYWLVTQLVKRKQIPCSRVGGKSIYKKSKKVFNEYFKCIYKYSY